MAESCCCHCLAHLYGKHRVSEIPFAYHPMVSGEVQAMDGRMSLPTPPLSFKHFKLNRFHFLVIVFAQRKAVVQQMYLGKKPPMFTDMRVLGRSTEDDHLVGLLPTFYIHHWFFLCIKSLTMFCRLWNWE